MPQVGQGKERLNCSIRREWRSNRKATQPLLRTLKKKQVKRVFHWKGVEQSEGRTMRKFAFSQGIVFLLLFPLISSCLQAPLPHPGFRTHHSCFHPTPPQEMCQAPIRQTRLHKCTLSPNEQKYSNLKMYIKCL